MIPDTRTYRKSAAHKIIRLMLLGSPPDMVHGTSLHRTRTSACQIAQPLLLRINTKRFAYYTISD